MEHHLVCFQKTCLFSKNLFGFKKPGEREDKMCMVITGKHKTKKDKTVYALKRITEGGILTSLVNDTFVWRVGKVYTDPKRFVEYDEKIKEGLFHVSLYKRQLIRSVKKDGWRQKSNSVWNKSTIYLAKATIPASTVYYTGYSYMCSPSLDNKPCIGTTRLRIDEIIPID